MFVIISAAFSISSLEWAAVTVSLILAVPTGTEGGLIAESKIPWLRQFFAKVRAFSALPVRIGIMAVSPFINGSPAFSRRVRIKREFSLIFPCRHSHIRVKGLRLGLLLRRQKEEEPWKK